MKLEVIKEHVPGTAPVWNCFWWDEKTDKLLMKAWILADGSISVRKFGQKQDIELHINPDDFKIKRMVIRHY